MSGLTFGEEIEITGIKDEIIEELNKGERQYTSNIITLKLQRIGKISRTEANKTIKELGLDKLGFKEESEIGHK